MSSRAPLEQEIGEGVRKPPALPRHPPAVGQPPAQPGLLEPLHGGAQAKPLEHRRGQPEDQGPQLLEDIVEQPSDSVEIGVGLVSPSPVDEDAGQHQLLDPGVVEFIGGTAAKARMHQSWPGLFGRL